MTDALARLPPPVPADPPSAEPVVEAEVVEVVPPPPAVRNLGPRERGLAADFAAILAGPAERPTTTNQEVRNGVRLGRGVLDLLVNLTD